MKIIPIRRALLSVSDKDGLIELANVLIHCGVEIISTGGTSRLLRDANIPYQSVEDLTGLPEMLSGRVKTLHPNIHGGILGQRDQDDKEAKEHGIVWIDLVVVNFYPFSDVIKKQKMTWDQVVEYIDIGGPTMVRAAAKNFAWVGVVVDPADYSKIIASLEKDHGLPYEMRKQLAEKAFAYTSHYDTVIHHYFFHEQHESLFPPSLHLRLEKHAELRYGENPHQKACSYQFKDQQGVLSAIQHQGKALSYNNILDSEAALVCVREFDQPACVIVKHANPCGVAEAINIEDAFSHAKEADPVSAFGGILALNRPCNKMIAEQIQAIFMEVIIAPSYTEEALTVFATKPNLRVLQMPMQHHFAITKKNWYELCEMKFITGGLLLQEKDKQVLNRNHLTIVTKEKPSSDDMDAMLFAWRVLKHIKSNGILIAKRNATVGIGAGQVSRIDAVDLAIRKAGDHIKDCIVASDAFFPFRDSIDRIANTGIRAIIQPGGSMRDEEVIAACNEYGLAMVLTGKRCFRH